MSIVVVACFLLFPGQRRRRRRRPSVRYRYIYNGLDMSRAVVTTNRRAKYTTAGTSPNENEMEKTKKKQKTKKDT